MFTVLFLLFLAANADPITFETNLTCHAADMGPDGWCAEGYHFDLDTGSDDPMYYFKECTKEETIQIKSSPYKYNEDGIFESHYEMDYVIYHSCNPHGNPVTKHGLSSDCSCVKPTGYRSLATRSHQVIKVTLNLSQQNDSSVVYKGCDLFPSAFEDTFYHCRRYFPKQGCSWLQGTTKSDHWPVLD